MKINVKQLLSNKKILCVFISSMIVIVKYILGDLYYAASDDYLMDYISQGKFGNGYDEHLVFINVIIGKIIKALNGVSEQINWFAVIFLLIVVSVFSILFYTFWNKIDSVMVLPVVSVVEILVLHNFTFTVIAYMCIFTSIIYFAYASERGISLCDGIIIIFFLVLGVMVRNNTLVTALILTVPLIIYGIIKLEKKKKLFVLLTTGIVCIFAVNTYDGYCYSDSLWKEFREYNAALKVIDYPMDEIKNNKQLLEKNDLSKNDIECFQEWIFSDKQVFSKEKLINLYNNNLLTNKYNFNIIDILRQMLLIKTNYLILILGIFIFILIEKKGRFYVIGSLGIMYAMIAALVFRNRLVFRVMLPIYLIGLCMILFFGLVYLKKQKRKIFSRCLFIVFLVLSILVLGQDYKGGIEKKEHREQYAPVCEYIRSNKDKVYLITPVLRNMMYNDIPILEKSEKTNQENIIPLGSWSTYSGKYYAQMKRYNIKQPERLMLELIENDNVQFIADNNADAQNKCIVKYLEEHTGQKVVCTVVKSFEEQNIVIYKMHKEEKR